VVPVFLKQRETGRLTLTVCNTDSLGEQIQRAFPDARVVKTLNTMNNQLMIHPERVPGAHSVFVSGDDAEAKQFVTGMLESFGWPPDRIDHEAHRRVAWVLQEACRQAIHWPEHIRVAVNVSAIQLRRRISTSWRCLPVCFWRHAEPIERAAPGRHADHDGELGLADQIDGRAGIAEHHFDIERAHFRARRQHGIDSLGDHGDIARSFSEEQGANLGKVKHGARMLSISSPGKSSCRRRRSRSHCGRPPPPPRRQQPRRPLPHRHRSPDTRSRDPDIHSPDSLRRALRQRRRPEVLELRQRRRGSLRHRPDSRHLRDREHRRRRE
jgi:hypothetical protein